MKLHNKYQCFRPCGFRQYFFFMFSLYKSKKDGKNQETIQPSITPDSGYNMGK